ncbi:MAG: hypothetical protein HYT03_02955 [Candidatus Harrisonbacteria bacterium]|nr:hypothetical protein [Candidatus Harrisonbacteria bacterium]
MAKDELNVEDLIFKSEKSDTDYLELPLSRQAFLLVGAAILIIGLIVFGRIGFLNIAKGGFYTNRNLANVHKVSDLPAPRGIIYDRYGEALVENKSSFSVFLNIAALLRTPEKIEETARQLAEILDLKVEEISAVIGKADLEKTGTLAIARNITLNQVIALKALKLSAVQVADDYLRDYKDGSIFGHILGYVGISAETGEVLGQSGLEAFYDSWLRGQDGQSIAYRDALGESLGVKTIANSTTGNDLITTIDADLQRYFYRRMQSGLATLGREAGVGLAMNPQTGEVLALVSLPSFDNNKVADYLNKSSKPLFNRAISGFYTPGSTIKPLVALAALKEKIIDPALKVLSIGYIEVPNPYDPEAPSRFLDWKAHGWVDLKSAIARSSNVYFYTLGGGLPTSESDLVQSNKRISGLGIEKLNEYWKKFLLGVKTGIDLPAESEGFLPNAEEKENRTGEIWRVGDTYNVSIGQGDLLLTPIQLLNFIASIANGGKIYRPFLIKDKNSVTLFDYSDWEELKEVQEGMIDTVRKYYGTANYLSGLPFPAAGKTGSAQVANNTRTNAFFVGYAPAEKPEIAILVLIENAREGSLNAVPIANDVLEWYYYKRLAND